MERMGNNIFVQYINAMDEKERKKLKEKSNFMHIYERENIEHKPLSLLIRERKLHGEQFFDGLANL